MSGQESRVYRFGDFVLEPHERRLSCRGASAALTPKVFDTLVLLVERAGRVVSKDDLMKALWPRGFVEESTLSNHIWQIRRALGETAKSTRFVETVPKVGYRFVAPVVLAPSVAIATIAVDPGPVDRAPDDPVPADPGPDVAVPDVAGPVPAVPTPAPSMTAAGSSHTRRPRVGLVAGLIGTALVLLVATGVGWRSGMRQSGIDAKLPTDRTVAIVGFNNLSQSAKDAWLGPALTAMLGSELSAADHVRVVPDELVREASQGLGAPLAGGYGAETLARLRRRLDADFVVTGSYWVAAGADDPTLRVDLQLQSARSGALVGTMSNLVSLSALASLVNQSGASLRERIGVSIPNPSVAALLANVRPPTTDVARRVGVALDAMERHDAARARDELLEAVAEAPGFAPAYLYLSRAWSALGYRQKALAAAQQAAARAADLPPELKLQIDAAIAVDSYEWGQAAATAKALVAMKPLSVEYRIDSSDAEIAMGDLTGAAATLLELKRLPQGAADPRVALASARLALARNDVKGAEAAAASALAESQERGLTGVAADAEFELASARLLLGQYAAAAKDAESAIAAYQAMGNPHGESAARWRLGSAKWDLNQVIEGREEYSRALDIAQRIGDAGEAGLVYRNQCSLLWFAGDRDGARAAGHQALAIARGTGDLQLQAWTLRALATIAADDAVTDEVLAEYGEVTELTERTHDAGGHVWSLATNADILRERGDLDAANESCARAMTEASVLTDPQFTVYSTFTCALIALDRGEIERSRTLLDKAATVSASSHNPIYAANAELVMGQIEFEAAHWAEAMRRLHGAAQSFAALEASTGEADAEALIALCAQAIGDAVERDRAAARARTLRASITAQQEIYVVDIALAELGDGPSATTAEHLRELALDAERRHFVAWSLEAKLAEWRLLSSQGSRAAIKARKALEAEARKRGFNRILALMNTASPRAV
jgi:DNA-binding winged helix-turn-helix (wHTH) protein/tetratricopeptide (TPR) repeat protein/TolB-like protein